MASTNNLSSNLPSPSLELISDALNQFDQNVTAIQPDIKNNEAGQKIPEDLSEALKSISQPKTDPLVNLTAAKCYAAFNNRPKANEILKAILEKAGTLNPFVIIKALNDLVVNLLKDKAEPDSKKVANAALRQAA